MNIDKNVLTFRRDDCINIHTGGREMSIQVKRIIIIGIIAIVAFVLGRLAVRALMNLLLGGTLFGGNIL